MFEETGSTVISEDRLAWTGQALNTGFQSLRAHR